MAIVIRKAPAGLARAVAIVGDRWALLVIEALLPGPRRFNELTAGLPGIAPNVLSHRLKHLEREGLVLARPYSERPPRLSYELTAAGKELAGVVRLLAHWGSARGEEEDRLRHRTCGTPMEARWYCPTCATVVDENVPADVRFV